MVSGCCCIRRASHGGSGLDWIPRSRQSCAPPSKPRCQGHLMSRLPLSIATTDYDHFRDFRLGLVTAEGIDHTWLTLGHHECFARFTANREFDLSELSFAKFTTQVSRDDADIIGLPVICSRLFRFSSFYVNKKSA